MRLGRLGRDDDVGPVARRLQRDRLANAAAGARDEQRPSSKFPVSDQHCITFFTLSGLELRDGKLSRKVLPGLASD